VVGWGCFLAGFSWLAQAHTHSSYATSVLGPTLIAAGISLASAVVSVLLPQARAAARREPTAPTTTLGTAARESGTGPGTAR
jgi:apolipoprotein N-acyltransferase